MDFINVLPIEITEVIISYLNGDDILRCCQVCSSWRNVLDKERTWKILSYERGWSRNENDRPTESWQDHYWLNHNWRNGIYFQHHQIIPEGGALQVGLNQRFVIISHIMGAQVWKFDQIPTFHETIYCDDFHFQTKMCGKSIVIKSRDSIHMYIQDKRHKNYKLIKSISENVESKDYESELKLHAAIIQTGCDRLAIVQKETNGHKILLWNLNDGFKYKPVHLEDAIKHVFKITIFNKKLYLVTLNKNEYRITICDLNKEYHMLEVSAFRNVAFGVIPPELLVNDQLIVAFCPTDIGHDLRYSYSPLKVWDSNGRVISSMILNSGRIDYFAFCLSNDLVIYRHSETLVKVWQPATDTEICSFNVEPKICQIDNTVGNLLVFSYQQYFDVWDYNKCNKLYRVQLVDNTCLASYDKVEINKYYYAKENRNKKLVTIYSFMNHLNDCDNKYMSDKYTKISDYSKGIM